MNKKVNAAITAGLSLSMVLSASPMPAIAAGNNDVAVQSVSSVMFVAGSGTFADGSGIMDASTNEDGVVAEPAAPTREGYKFDGWCYDAAGNYKADLSQPLQGGNGHFTLYAKWVEAPAEKTGIDVLYYANGGTFANGSDTLEVKNAENGLAQQPEAPTREGYVFAGWCYDSAGNQPVDFSQPITAGSGHATLYAKWVKAKEDKSIDVLYAANGGTFADGNETLQGVTDSDGFARVPATPTREGYAFTGWTYDKDGKQPVDFTQAIQGGGDHVTLFAQWSKLKNNEKDVLYVANGGVFADGNETLQGVTDTDGIARKPGAPTREGYTFIGWTYDSEGTQPVDFDYPVQGGGDHVTFYAQWQEVEKDNSIEVLYVANGGSFVTGEATVTGRTDGNRYARQPLAPTRDGYTFAGWTYDSEGTQAVDFDNPIPGGGDHVTLFAQWTPVKKDGTIEVLYVANGGTFADGNETLQGVTDADGIARQPLAPTREGYTFAGWTYDAAGTQPVDFSQAIPGGGDHVTFFAQWIENETPAAETHKVTFYVNGAETTVEVEDGATVEKPADPAVDGFDFYGWSSSKDEYAAFDFDAPITDDVTVYAFFTAQPAKPADTKKDDEKKDDAEAKKDEAKDAAAKKDDAKKADSKKSDSDLPQTGDPTFVITSAAALTGAVAAAVGMYMTKRREH